MAVYKLNLEEFETEAFHLIAIHTTMEDSKLAFLINQKLGVLLKMDHADIQIETKIGFGNFKRFYFFDEKTNIQWDLVQSQNSILKKNQAITGLFYDISSVFSIHLFLLPEHKKADYFLKITPNENDISIVEIQKKLNAIKNLTTAYSIDPKTIKSKNNLIF
jgi:hypothetical protein